MSLSLGSGGDAPAGVSNFTISDTRGIDSGAHYRPDIDGLRALAVISVIAFHIGIPAFSGGFVGVDVFFVISGYLITGTLISDIERGRFSLKRFYERRIRRIFPALFAMAFATSAFAGAFFLPTDLRDFGRSLVAAVASLSNVYFWSQSGYFDAVSSTRPLLHTWSLGVEEQFYIAFPLLLALLRPHKAYLMKTLAAIAACSLLVSILTTGPAPAAAFYLLPARAWELMLGSMLSIAGLPAVSARLRDVIALGGLALILAANFLFTQQTAFPGAAALAPCCGAGLLIAAGKGGGSPVSKVLSLRPVVFLGKISYSLYLWHWPLLVFQRTNGVSPGIARILFLPVLLGISVLSWSYIEQPFRNGRLKLKGSRLFTAAAAAAACGLALGLFFVAEDGLPSRFPAKVVKVASFLDYDPSGPYRGGVCLENNAVPAAACLDKDAGKKNYLLFGDSHAAQLWAGLSSAFPDINFMQATTSGCLPVVSADAGPGHCSEMISYVLNDYLPKNQLDGVVIAARWRPDAVSALSKSIAEIKKHQANVILIGPIFEYASPLPRLLANDLLNRYPRNPEQHFNLVQQSLDAEMQRLASDQWHVRYVSLFQIFCSGRQCRTYASETVPMQFDNAHLTRDGSILVAERLHERGDLP